MPRACWWLGLALWLRALAADAAAATSRDADAAAATQVEVSKYFDQIVQIGKPTVYI